MLECKSLKPLVSRAVTWCQPTRSISGWQSNSQRTIPTLAVRARPFNMQANGWSEQSFLARHTHSLLQCNVSRDCVHQTRVSHVMLSSMVRPVVHSRIGSNANHLCLLPRPGLYSSIWMPRGYFVRVISRPEQFRGG
jgi:hypothetical protein